MSASCADLMLSGVTIEDPATTYIDAGVRVGQDTILRPGTTISGATVIGERCEIGPQSVIRDSQIGDDCLALASWVEEAVMESGSRVGPMSHLRPGARLTGGRERRQLRRGQERDTRRGRADAPL